MKKLGLICIIFFYGAKAHCQKFGDNKTAKIISFRIESNNPGIGEKELVFPLSQQLERIFRFTEVELAANTTIQWRNENPFNKFKKLSKEELEQTSPGNETLLLKVEIEHRYNPVLGGLIKKGKRHVMRLKLALFTSSGQRVWYHKTKDSCCIDLGVSDDDEYMYEDMEASEFLDLYRSVLEKTLGKL